jgi:hypothetical protein
MVRTFNLVQGSAAKYVDGVNALGPGRFAEYLTAHPFPPAPAPRARVAPGSPAFVPAT